MNSTENANLICDLNKIKEQIPFEKFKNLTTDSDDQKMSLSFLYYICLKFLNKDFNEIEDIITDGTNDNDIDIFDIEDEENSSDTFIVNLFQVKYKTSNNLNRQITDNEVDLFLRSIKDIFIDNVEKIKNNILEKQINKFQELNNEKKVKFHLYLVTNAADLSDMANEKLKTFERECSPTFKVTFLNKYQDLTCDYGENITEPISFEIADDIIKYNKSINSAIVNIRLFDLAELYDKFGERLFVENIRGELKSDINKQIEKTIEETPEIFWYKNNGISIICKRFEDKKVLGKRSIEIEGIQIVNGGQTTRCIYNVYRKFKKNADERLENLYSSFALTKIYQTTDDDLIDNITTGTNTQNNIFLQDLYSKNKNLIMMKEYFDKQGVDLVIRRDNKHLKLKNSIDNQKVFQSYCSIFKGMPSSAKNNKTKLFSDHFLDFFDKNKDRNFAENYFEAYLIYIFVDKKINAEIPEKRKILDYAIFHLMYIMKNIQLKENLTIEDAYVKSRDIIIELFNSIKDYTPANYFKANISTNDINNKLNEL